MHSKTLLTALSGLALVSAQVPLINGTISGPIVPGTTGRLGDAEITENNPVGVVYQAILPNRNTSDIRGYIAGTANSNGTGVQFNINFFGFPSAALGPFSELSFSSFSLIHLPLCFKTIKLTRAPHSVPHPRPTHPLQWQLHCRPCPSGPVHPW